MTMNVRTRPTLTGMLAIAAAGIFAAGTVGDRANKLYGNDDEPTPSPAAAYFASASDAGADDRELDAIRD